MFDSRRGRLTLPSSVTTRVKGNDLLAAGLFHRSVGERVKRGRQCAMQHVELASEEECVRLLLQLTSCDIRNVCPFLLSSL